MERWKQRKKQNIKARNGREERTLKKYLLMVVLVVILSSVQAQAAHYEQRWIQDPPSGHWDSVPVTTSSGGIRYQAKWIQDPPSGHYETVLVYDPVYIAPVIPIYIPPPVYCAPPVYYAPAPVYVGPYYGGRGHHGGHRRCR